MTRLLIYGVLLGFFSDALRRAVIVEACSLLLPLILILALLVVLTVKRWRWLMAKPRLRARPLFKWPPQSKRPTR